MNSNSLNDILYGYIKNNQKELLEEALRSVPTPVDFILIKSAILMKTFPVIPTLFTHYCANYTLRSEQIDSLLDYCAIAGEVRALDYFLLHKDLNLNLDKYINNILMTASINGHFHILDYLYNLKPEILSYMEHSLGEAFLANSGANVWVANIKEVLQVRNDLDNAIPHSAKFGDTLNTAKSLDDEYMNKI